LPGATSPRQRQAARFPMAGPIGSHDEECCRDDGRALRAENDAFVRRQPSQRPQAISGIAPGRKYAGLMAV
jgi:hypothetical protein